MPHFPVIQTSGHISQVYAFESWDLETARLLSSQSMGRHEHEGKEVIIRVEKRY